MVRLDELTFSNSTLHALPVEADKGRSHTPHQVRGCVFSVCTPTPLRQPTLVAASQAALSLLGLDAEEVREIWHQTYVYNALDYSYSQAFAYATYTLPLAQAQRDEFVQVMAGNRVLPGMEPAAHCKSQ